jgi:hypothetical protein
MLIGQFGLTALYVVLADVIVLLGQLVDAGAVILTVVPGTVAVVAIESVRIMAIVVVAEAVVEVDVVSVRVAVCVRVAVSVKVSVPVESSSRQ